MNIVKCWVKNKLNICQEWSWLEGALSEALGEQILLEAMALKENYEIVDENVLKQVKALRAKV